MLRRSAALGAVAAVPANVLAQAASAAPYANFTPAEAATLEAIVARLIPSDCERPRRARGRRGALHRSRARRRARRAASGVRGGPRGGRRLRARRPAARSPRLPPDEQDELHRRSRAEPCDGLHAVGEAFFELVLGHTLEGTFGDPHYGGNRDFIGWELIGYPGLRLAVTAEQQRMNAQPEPTRSSAYDLPMFDEHTTAGERDGR